MNSSVALAGGSGITLTGAAPTGCTDVLICHDGTAYEWTRGRNVWSLPIGSHSFIRHFCTQVASAWNPVVTWCAEAADPSVNGDLPQDVRMRVHRGPFRGSAGCLRDVSAALSGGTILLIEGPVWIDDDLAWMLRRHRASRNVLTVFCRPRPITLRGDALSTIEPLGMYFIEPEAIEYMAHEGVQDVAAHLIPALQQAGKRVGVVTLRGETAEVFDWSSYLRVLGHALKREPALAGAGFEQKAPGVWQHPDAVVSSGARVVGPVLIDRGCRVESGAVVIGPTILGPDCVVEPCARVVRTVALGNARFPVRPVVTDMLVTVDGAAPDGVSALQNASGDAPLEETAPSAAGAAPWRGAAWFALFMLAGVLAWTLSGGAGQVLQAWAQHGAPGAG